MCVATASFTASGDPGSGCRLQRQDRRVGISSLPTSSYLAINLPTRVSGYIRHLAPVGVWGMGRGERKEVVIVGRGEGRLLVTVVCVGGGGGRGVEIVMMVREELVIVVGGEGR